jgi:hypothetical protein
VLKYAYSCSSFPENVTDSLLAHAKEATWQYASRIDECLGVTGSSSACQHTSKKIRRFSALVEARKHAACRWPGIGEAGKGSQQCDAATTHGSSELRPDRREQHRADVPVIDLPLRGVLGRWQVHLKEPISAPTAQWGRLYDGTKEGTGQRTRLEHRA